MMSRRPGPATVTNSSLAFRLIAGAAVWSIAALVVGGITLSMVFRDHVERSLDDRLALLIDGLAAGVELDGEGRPILVRPLAETLFETPYTGWYWQIGGAGQEGLRSRSLWAQVLRAEPAVEHEAGLSLHYARGPEDQFLRVARRQILLPEAEHPLGFEVAADLADNIRAIDRFDRVVFWALGIMGFGLVVAMVIQVRFGLLPLRRIRRALVAIRDGRASRLDCDFPREIAPLAGEINTLLDHNAEVVGRARTHVGNLAHALKTPLSVLRNEAAETGGPLAEQVTRQTALMRRQVDHHLMRARAAATADVLGARAEVGPVVADLARAIGRLHRDSGIEIGLDCAPGLAFRGEGQDLEEMVGNLLENAAKWGRRRVRLAFRLEGPRLAIDIDDDGPGLEPEAMERVMARGERLDESVAGSGLGLAIVRDLAELYGGEIRLERSDLGGLGARLRLPAVAD